MRLSVETLFLGLPLLAAAADNAPPQSFLQKVQSYIPTTSYYDPADALEAKQTKKFDVMTIENWKDILWGPVKPAATKPEEFWVLFTGGNKTCYGRCGNIEKAFNESVPVIAKKANAPHFAYVNCDQQPILCNSWSTIAGRVWMIDMVPPPAVPEIYVQRHNLTTVTAKDLIATWKSGAAARTETNRLESWWHPFKGKMAVNGLSLPFGYLFWVMGLLPQWAFMLIISFVSRSMMNRRMNNFQGRNHLAQNAPAAPAN